MQRRAFLSIPLTLAASSANGSDTFQAFGLTWRAPVATDWQVVNESGAEVLKLVVARPQQANPRRPFQYALAETGPLSRFSIELELQREPKKGSLILVYAWQDAAHFNYLHLSDDAAEKVHVHNGVFHCFEGDRVRISALAGPGTLSTDGWHKVKMNYDASGGLLEAWVDGKTSPSLKAADLSLGAGLIGLGSFFNTGNFRNFKLTRG